MVTEKHVSNSARDPSTSKEFSESAYTKSTWPWGRDTFTYNLLPPDNKTAKPESNNKNTYIFNFS